MTAVDNTQSSSSDYQALTAYVAEFAANTSLDDIPDEVVHLGKKNMLDGLGVAISGAATEPCALLRDYLKPYAVVEPGVTVIGSSLRLPPHQAALANGMAMHVDDFDDTMQAATGKYQGIHPTNPVICALLAVAEPMNASGRDVLEAFHVGVEVACKLFDATNPEHILNGFHSTATCGMIGAAAAVARLKKLSTDGMRQTIGIAASQTGGLTENFGTMTKPFHAGRSAREGIISAELAERGFTASPNILEAPRGFFRALGGGYEAWRIDGRMGNPWSFVDRGIWLKPWPTGSLSHPAMTLMADLVAEHDIKPDEVRRIGLKTSENIYHTLLHHKPTTELESKFSLEFCLAALLVDRKLGLAQFTDDYVRSEPIQQAIAKVDYSTFDNDEAKRNDYTIVTSFIELELSDGRTVSGRKDFGKGSKANPMTDREVEDKVRDCAMYRGHSEDAADRLISAVWGIDKPAPVMSLVSALRGTLP